MLKWKWRFITDEVALWKGILEHMYSSPSSSLALVVMSNDGVGGRKYDYIWWRHIISLGYDKEKSSDLFVGNILGTLSDGRRISFWHYKWLPNQSLKELDELEILLFEKVPEAACLDNFVWTSHASIGFSVSTYYNLLFQVNPPCVIEDNVVEALKELWRSKLPFEIQIFIWRFFLDKKTTKDQLLNRGINFGGSGEVVGYGVDKHFQLHSFLNEFCETVEEGG
ncbi:hypothetical protein KIW84_056849 [Lathyrus oleraceus]|uniref:Reverse transcriptase zinc-binding domain-containing protein n=1 Tax=Pisum sativum TaxID=3888 RepID=A0A9D4X2L1_PEA|nr:hypothetical protein KIW84_056849 [Pisum sativum]